MGNFFRRLFALPTLLRDPNVNILKKVMVVAGLIYILSPVDIISDPIFVFGLVDDAMLATYIVSSMKEELDKYVSINSKSKKSSIKKNKVIDDVEYKIEDE